MVGSIISPHSEIFQRSYWRNTRYVAAANDNAQLSLKSSSDGLTLPARRLADPARRNGPRESGRPVVQAAVKMTRESSGVVNLMFSDIRIEQSAKFLEIEPLRTNLERAAALPEGRGPERRSEACEMTVAAVGEFQHDGTSMALVFRFLAAPRESLPAPESRSVQHLPKWRLKRVMDYIEANLAEPISLSGLAEAAGLSPAYFAAQFRATTGLRPHEYLLRRRIREAQRLLLDPQRALVDIALSVGFQTQAHFTTVFKRFVGDTPCRWRRQNYAEA
jgi:AraC-like DNA-binding protein